MAEVNLSPGDGPGPNSFSVVLKHSSFALTRRVPDRREAVHSGCECSVHAFSLGINGAQGRPR